MSRCSSSTCASDRSRNPVSFRASSITFASFGDVSLEIVVSFTVPSTSSSTHGLPLLFRVRVQFSVPRRHRSYEALRLPYPFRLPLRSSLTLGVLDHRREDYGSPRLQGHPSLPCRSHPPRRRSHGPPDLWPCNCCLRRRGKRLGLREHPFRSWLRAAQLLAHLRIAAAIAVYVARCRYRLRGLALPDGTFTRRTTFRVSVLHLFLLSDMHFLVTPHVGSLTPVRVYVGARLIDRPRPLEPDRSRRATGDRELAAVMSPVMTRALCRVPDYGA